MFRAMEQSKALVVKWAALTSGEKAAKVVARIVQNKMDIVDLKDVSGEPVAAEWQTTAEEWLTAALIP